MIIEAMKQALEALYPISHNSTDDYRGQADKAIVALRTAIEQAEKQEPVAWGIANTRPTERNPLMMVMLDEPAPSHLVVPLYAHPQPKREPLTDEECADLWDMQVIHITDKVSAKQFIRDIEAAHGIKEEKILGNNMHFVIVDEIEKEKNT
jgi:hypothetical protein